VACAWNGGNSAIRIGIQMLAMISTIVGLIGTVGGKTVYYSWYFFLAASVAIVSFISMCYDADFVRKGNDSCLDATREDRDTVSCKPTRYALACVWSAACFVAWTFSTWTAWKAYRSRKANVAAKSSAAAKGKNAMNELQEEYPKEQKPANPFAI
jgi:hypothetical protein